jgi:hypothetical protein
MADVEDAFNVTRVPSRSYTVHVSSNECFVFNRIQKLYVCDMSELRVHDSVDMNNERVHFQTVASNEALYTKREVEEAKQASQLIKELGYPSLRDAIELVSRGAIANCSVTPQAIVRIYGPDPASLMGKTKLIKPTVVKIENVPRPIFVSQVLHVDVMFVESDLSSSQ